MKTSITIQLQQLRTYIAKSQAILAKRAKWHGVNDHFGDKERVHAYALAAKIIYGEGIMLERNEARLLYSNFLSWCQDFSSEKTHVQTFGFKQLLKYACAMIF